MKTDRQKRRYPDMKKIRYQQKSVSMAVKILTDMKIEILNVRFRNSHPLIEIANCPGIERLPNALKGRGHNEHGSYIKKVALIKGCQIEWSEPYEPEQQKTGARHGA